MNTRSNIIMLAALTLTGAAALTTPSYAQANAGPALGIPNVTAPTDSVRQGAAGINAAQAEATRTTGDAVRDAEATAENETAGVGDPSLGVTANANAAGQSAAVSGSVSSRGTVSGATNRAANATANQASNLAGRTEREVTRQLNLEQSANASASVSGSTR
jgi:hypothetical protein